MIESVNNEKVKMYSKLNDKKYREEMNLFIIEGKHLVEEAIKKGIIKEVFLLNGEESIYENTTYVTEEVIKKISSLNTPPKIIAICHKLTNQNIEGNILIIDDISDPGNLGTIIRNAVAFNYQTIIMSPNTVDIYNPKVIRASEGMLFHINLITSDLLDIMPELKKDNYTIYGSSPDNGVEASKTNNKHALVIGSEARGISKEVLDLCDENLYIKMNPLCESLNAGVSSGILMHELNK